RINLMFRQVIRDMIENNEVNVKSRYESLERNNVVGDFEFIVMEKYVSQDTELPFLERIIMKLYFWIKDVGLSEEKGFGLDTSNIRVEKFPLVVGPIARVNLKRSISDA